MTAPAAVSAAPAQAAMAQSDRLALASSPGQDGTPDRLALVPVSNPRPELVSGGEILVRVEVPPRISALDVHVFADGHEVTSDFETQSDGSLLWLVTGLKARPNKLDANRGGHVGL